MADSMNIIVQEQVRDRYARVASAKIGEKSILTPSFFTLIQDAYELDLLTEIESQCHPNRLGGVVVRIFDARRTLEKVQMQVPRDIFGRVREDKYSLLMKRHALLVDPSFEYIYYEGKMGKFTLDPQTHEIVVNYISALEQEKTRQESTRKYNQAKEKLHSGFWKGIIADNRKEVGFIKDILERQWRFGADVTIPPVPLITSRDMLSIAIEINDKSRELSRLGGKPCATYFLLKNSLIRDHVLLESIKEYIAENSSQALTLFKFKYLDLTDPKLITDRENYGRLMLDLAYFSQTFPNRACMVLENYYQTFTSPVAGFDFVSSSFTAQDGGEMSFSEHPSYGQYLDPKLLVHRNFDEMAEVYKNSHRRLPCTCIPCRSVTIKDLKLMPPDAWNTLRRKHTAAFMDIWMEYIAQAVQKKNVELIIDRLSNSKISILKDLLPKI